MIGRAGIRYGVPVDDRARRARPRIPVGAALIRIHGSRGVDGRAVHIQVVEGAVVRFQVGLYRRFDVDDGRGGISVGR